MAKIKAFSCKINKKVEKNMEREKIIETIKKMVCEKFEVEEVNFDEEFFLDNIGANSIDMLEFLLSIELEFDIEFEDEDMDGELLNNLNNLVKFIEGKKL